MNNHFPTWVFVTYCYIDIRKAKMFSLSVDRSLKIAWLSIFRKSYLTNLTHSVLISNRLSISIALGRWIWWIISSASSIFNVQDLWGLIRRFSLNLSLISRHRLNFIAWLFQLIELCFNWCVQSFCGLWTADLMYDERQILVQQAVAPCALSSQSTEKLYGLVINISSWHVTRNVIASVDY